jgi:uncharacterized protein (TIGR02996 family)
MSDQSALFAAICAHPDDDTPRLAYADWLDEHLPDRTPSPAAGPSARAEYIRVQCRLAQYPFDDPEYPELLERQDDLAEWLNAHTPGAEVGPDVPDRFEWYGQFDGGEFRTFDRGFPVQVEFTDYEDELQENIDQITDGLPEIFARSTVRGLLMEEAYGSEVAGILAHPSAAGLRSFDLADMADDEDGATVRGIAASPHLTRLRYLGLDIALDTADLKRLAKARLPALESFSLEVHQEPDLTVLGPARWFRGLRWLRLRMYDRDAFTALADLPPMPNLVSLAVRGRLGAPTAAAVRRFAASASFPRLARFELGDCRLTPEQLALFAAGPWPLRHLKLAEVPVQRAGAEALADAAFADTLRVLDLRECSITAGGVQALAGSERLAGLKHLNLSANPLGAGGLFALARSEHLRGLRALSLHRCNTRKAPLDAATVLNFLSALEMPDLRHLNLDTLPVCVRGARALAAGAPFGHLTRLCLNECGLGEKGARAIVEGPVFADLAVLEMRSNGAGSGASKLANPKVFPRLAAANLRDNRIPKGPLARLRKRPGVRV